VVNGWDLAVDNNKAKSVGFQIALTPTPPVAVFLNYMGGPEMPDTSAFMRHIGDVVATYTVNDLLTLGINGDYGLEKGTSAVTPGGDAKWTGVAGYAKISPNANFFVALRAETLNDAGGVRFGLNKNTTANEFTVTPTYKVARNFVVRAEGRYDSINLDKVFFRDKATSKRNQATLGFNAIFVY
jgi:hypothetical protein